MSSYRGMKNRGHHEGARPSRQEELPSWRSASARSLGHAEVSVECAAPDQRLVSEAWPPSCSSAAPRIGGEGIPPTHQFIMAHTMRLRAPKALAGHGRRVARCCIVRAGPGQDQPAAGHGAGVSFSRRVLLAGTVASAPLISQLGAPLSTSAAPATVPTAALGTDLQISRVSEHVEGLDWRIVGGLLQYAIASLQARAVSVCAAAVGREVPVRPTLPCGRAARRGLPAGCVTITAVLLNAEVQVIKGCWQLSGGHK